MLLIDPTNKLQFDRFVSYRWYATVEKKKTSKITCNLHGQYDFLQRNNNDSI